MVQTSTHAIEELRPGQQWVCFDKDKIPYNPLTGQEAKANDASTWATYEQAERVSHRYQGIGREFLKEQGITGIDLDHCIDDQGQLTPFAQETISRLDSYTEYSPSGRGLHIWIHGNIPKNLGADKDADGENGVEMYDCKRYFTITGKHFPGTPTMIEDRREVLLAFHGEVCARRQAAKAKQRASKPRATSPTKITQANGSTPYGLKALADECAILATTGEGGRNQQLNNSAFSMGQLIGGHELSRAIVEQDLSGAAERAGLNSREIENTLRSGIEAGIQSPRSAPIEPRTATNGGGNGITNRTAIGLEELPDASVGLVLDCLTQGEWGDSLLFAHLFMGKAIYDHTEKEWYIWHNHYWVRDDTGRIKHYVSGKLAGCYLRTSAKLVEGNDSDPEQKKKTDAQIAALAKRALELRSVNKCKNILYFAASHEGMGIAANQWDTNKWLLAVPNGVINLQTGTRRDGQPGDYIRTVCPTKWQGLDAAAPRWEKFLQEIFEDRKEEERAQLLAFLVRLFGYGITGETREHVFTVLYGEDGRNGKDTLQRAISYALGQASGVVSKDVLLDSGKQHTAGAATPHLSDLQGKRIAWASEPEKGARFNIGQVKELSGGGDITTRSPYDKQFYIFKPTHLLVLLTNHKPHADANDSAFWDRLQLITFNMRFVDKPQEPNERKRDVTLWDTLEQEAPGILAWLVRGCLAWQQRGLDTPSFITQAGQEYRKEEDTIGLFVDECCIVKPDAEVPAGRIYDEYKTWCSDGNMKTINSTNFGRLFSKRFRKEKNYKGATYYGVGLRDTNSPPPDDTLTSSQNPSGADKAAIQATLDDTQASKPDESDGFYTKNTNSPIVNTSFDLVSNKTSQTRQDTTMQNGINPPVKSPDDTLTSSQNPSGAHDIETGDYVVCPDQQTGRVTHVSSLSIDVQVYGNTRHYTANQFSFLKLVKKA